MKRDFTETAKPKVKRIRSAVTVPIRSHVADTVEAVALFTQTDAEAVASRYLFRFGRVPRDDLFLGPLEGPVRRYEAARRQLKGFSIVDLTRVGFHLVPNWVTAEEVAAVLHFCHGVPDSEWETRLGTNKCPIEGTQRKNFGITAKYEKARQAAGKKHSVCAALPDVLANMGIRALNDCKVWSKGWSTTCTDISKQGVFEQAYVQRYKPGQTLGFHFDERGAFCELICGVTICGEGNFLLSSTSGSQEISKKQQEQDNVASVKLPPLSLYVMTGMSRFDLRHAVVQHGQAERISVTFRSPAPKNWIKESLCSSRQAHLPSHGQHSTQRQHSAAEFISCKV